MKALRLRHAWPEPSGFSIRHKPDREDYIFIHFYNSVELTVNGKASVTAPHACVVFDRSADVYFRSPTPLLHDWLHFSGDDTADFLKSTGICVNTVYYPKSPSAITEVMRELEAEYYGAGKFSDIVCEGKLRELFVKLARGVDREEIPVIFGSEVLKRFALLRRDIRSNPKEDWPAKRMAEYVHLSESRFFSVYKEIYGITPKDEVIRARVECAKTLLCDDKNSLEKVAEMAGYKSVFHFLRQFKSRTGMTPGEWRKNT